VMKRSLVLVLNPDWTVTIVNVPQPRTGSLVSVQCDQPPLICFGVCGRKATILSFVFLFLKGRWFETRIGQ
jgi:hypothetical protein